MFAFASSVVLAVERWALYIYSLFIKILGVALALLVGSVFVGEEAHAANARLCNESERTYLFIETESEAERIREPASLMVSRNGYTTRTVIHRKANGWFRLDPGRCVSTGTGSAWDPTWIAFTDIDGTSVMLTPRRSVVYENRPESLCYASNDAVRERHRAQRRLFGMQVADTFYVEQTDSCESPDYEQFRVSFGVLALGNVDYTITIE